MKDKDTGPIPPANSPAEEYPEEKAERKPARRFVWVLWALVLIPAIYFTVQVFILMMPRMRTQTAIQDTMTDSIYAQGFVVMQSSPVEAQGGFVYYSVPLGQRVAQDAEVAKVFSSAEGISAMRRLAQLDAEIAMVQDAQNTHAEGGDVDVYLKQLQGGLFEMLAMMDKGRYEDLQTAADEVALADNRMQVVTGESTGFEARLAALQAERDQLAATTVPTSSIGAPKPGFFVPAVAQDRVTQTHEALSVMDPSTLQAALAAPASYYGSTVVGHIIEDYKWSFFAVLPLKEVEKCPEGTKLELAFPEVSDEKVPMVVESVTQDPETGLAKVEFTCEYMRPFIMRLRNEKAQIILRTEKGIRIDKSAMRIIEGENCVYVKFGNQVFKRKIKILLEDENYLLLPEEYEKDVNEVQLYDEVVVDSGGEELYDKKVL